MYALYGDFYSHYIVWIAFYHLTSFLSLEVGIITSIMWLNLGLVPELLAIVLFYEVRAFSLVFCWYFWYLCCFLEKPQISLFALWFSLQFAHFRMLWGHSFPFVLQALQLCKYVLCLSAHIWQIAEALYSLVECPHF